jgi:hypothetical protein
MHIASVAKLVDAPDLGSDAARRESSNLSRGTTTGAALNEEAGPGRLAAKDSALSRRQHGFESRPGYGGKMSRREEIEMKLHLSPHRDDGKWQKRS